MLTPAVIWAVGTMLAPGSIKYVWGSVSVSTAFISVCLGFSAVLFSAVVEADFHCFFSLTPLSPINSKTHLV